MRFVHRADKADTKFYIDMQTETPENNSKCLYCNDTGLVQYQTLGEERSEACHCVHDYGDKVDPGDNPPKHFDMQQNPKESSVQIAWNSYEQAKKDYFELNERYKSLSHPEKMSEIGEGITQQMIGKVRLITEFLQIHNRLSAEKAGIMPGVIPDKGDFSADWAKVTAKEAGLCTCYDPEFCSTYGCAEKGIQDQIDYEPMFTLGVGIIVGFVGSSLIWVWFL